jgi:nitrite reductase/ring-hydroxylating ferredoxin subunit
MNWIKALDADTLGEDGRQVVEVEDHKVLLLKHNGKLYATQHTCPHMGAPLKRSKLEGNSIVCPLHRSTFDLETGDVQTWAPWPPVVGAVLGAVKQERALRVYKTKIEDGAVWVDLDTGAQ